MAIIDEPRIELERAKVVTPVEALGVFARPTSDTGWRSWITTVDHKKIGIMYGVTALFFFVVGGFEALLIRLQLARPNGTILSAQTYNELFTMHGTTMVFLVIMPMAAAFSNYLIPLQIGARDVAFPRLNAFSYWCFLFGGIFLNLSWFLGGAPDGGWFAYAPNTTRRVLADATAWTSGRSVCRSPASPRSTGAVNLIVTVLNMRAPGMTLMRMPIFTWMALVIQFLLLFAIPVITVALFLLQFDRLFGANFFEVNEGADPLLWQHFFWIFGHPEVYILILPSFGIVSEVLPVFSRKPLFGYPFVVFSGVAIGFMGWGVWAHHMFASSLGPVSVAAFSLSTMFIAVPTGVKIINWLATMWGGRLRLTVAMMFAIGLVVLFTIGGLSGVTHAVAPSDTQQTDTYYIVAHFHYVLFGGAVMGLFAGFYYWWPKIFGQMLSETWGKVNFWLMFIGMNLTFGPMHIVGLEGQPRRMYSLRAGHGLRHVEPRRVDRCVHPRGGHPRVHPERHQDGARSEGPGGSVGCPHDRVDDDLAAEAPQLRLDDPGRPPRRVLAPQVRGGRGRARPQAGGDLRAGDGGRGARRAHPHAVAVVLADHHRLRPAAHRRRSHLQPVDLGDRRAHRVRRALRAGARARDGARGAPRRGA